MSMLDPDFDRPAKPSKDAADSESVAATSCLQWGIIAMFTWWIPAFGQVFSIAGLIRGRRGWHASNRDRARLGVVLSVIALMLGLALIALVLECLRTMPDF